MLRPLLLLALCSLLLGARLQAVQTDTHGIHAVPAPAPVVIDGKLDEWDLSGSVLQCYDVEALRDIYSADIAMMYDPANLYVALHWRCQNPMTNSHDPRYQADKGWAGDCVQLRIKTDRIVHVTAWYYAAKQEPAIQLSYGKGLSEPFGGGGKQLYRTDGWKLTDGAEMAFRKDADGKGYVQEIKLPWALITNAKRYGAGDSFACGIELLWGAADWPIHRYADNMADGATSREFFFTAKDAWGPVLLEAAGRLKLPPPSWHEGPAEPRRRGRRGWCRSPTTCPRMPASPSPSPTPPARACASSPPPSRGARAPTRRPGTGSMTRAGRCRPATTASRP